MKTYNERIEELNKKVKSLEGDIANIDRKEWEVETDNELQILKDRRDRFVIQKREFEAKIEQLDELRAEAIEEVKELLEKNKQLEIENQNSPCQMEDTANEIINVVNYGKNEGKIDYLKAKWSIEDSDVE